jgi:hypothetical protein
VVLKIKPGVLKIRTWGFKNKNLGFFKNKNLGF